MTDRKSEDDSVDFVRVGKVSKAHGIKGEVRVYPDFGPPEDFLDYKELVVIRPDTGLRQVFKVLRCRPQANFVIIHLEGFDDRSMAEKLAGSEVLLDKDSLPVAPKAGFYWHDLVGLQVETESGRKLGRVETLFATGGHDVLVVLDGGREYLIPLQKEFLINTDFATGILTVAEVPGLFEIND